MIRFQALGGLTITDEGEEVVVGGPRQRRLLAVLLIHRDAVVSLDRLADAVFAGEPTPGATTTLRSYIARIRRVVDGIDPAPRVVTQAPGYMLRVPVEAFDVACFEDLLAGARSRLAREDPVGASTVLREALALWRGEAYEEFADEDWARPEAQRLGELRLVAYESLFDAELACGRAAESIPELEALARAHETREAFRAQLMVALYRCGRQADALEVYQDYRRFLVDELGLDPTPTLEDLERRILSHDPSLQLAQPAGQPLRGYRLGERLGTGRDGTVYAASLPGVDRDLALRVVHESIADRPEFVRSFEAKAHRLAAIRHPAIVRLQDYWREPGAAYLVMRRMHGGTLARSPRPAADERGRGGDARRPHRRGARGGRGGGYQPWSGERRQRPARRGRRGLPGRLPAHPTRPGRRPLVGRSATSPPWSPSASVRRADGVREALDRAEVDGGGLPMAEFVSLVVGALTGVSRRADAPRPNPYKGLRAFDETDALDFFGRADLVENMLGRLAGTDVGHRLLLLVGGSGTGKSSVVRAGLLPRVRRGDIAGSDAWFITSMLPGSAPFEALAEGLRQVAVGESDAWRPTWPTTPRASTGSSDASCPTAVRCCW